MLFDDFLCRVDPITDHVWVDPDPPHVRNRPWPNRVRRVTTRTETFSPGFECLAGLWIPVMGTLDVLARLGDPIERMPYRGPTNPTIPRRKQGFTPVFIGYIEAVYSDVIRENACNFVADIDIAYPTRSVFERGVLVGLMSEFDERPTNLIRPPQDEDDAGRSTAARRGASRCAMPVRTARASARHTRRSRNVQGSS